MSDQVQAENPISSFTMLPITTSPVPFPARLTRKRRVPCSESPPDEELQSKRIPILSPSLKGSISVPIESIENAEDSQILNSLVTASTELLKYSLSPAKSSRPPLPPTIRRTTSTPITSDFYPAPTFTTPPAPARSNSPEKPSLPPLPPSIHRTSSAPIPSEYQVTPPRAPAPAKSTVSDSPGSGTETPNSKRLRRMKEKMQEMTEWCYKVMQEADPDETIEADNDEVTEADHGDTAASEDETTKVGDECENEISAASEDNATKVLVEDDTTKGGNEIPQESVWVDEINGEGSVVHFKCPCGSGYQILLDGKDCYYKLM